MNQTPRESQDSKNNITQDSGSLLNQTTDSQAELQRRLIIQSKTLSYQSELITFLENERMIPNTTKP